MISHPRFNVNCILLAAVTFRSCRCKTVSEHEAYLHLHFVFAVDNGGG